MPEYYMHFQYVISFSLDRNHDFFQGKKVNGINKSKSRLHFNNANEHHVLPTNLKNATHLSSLTESKLSSASLTN